ncbi:MAG: hypothetical protein J6P97_05495 [Bacteroidales bacterium]|nr:hypothetical protein [Bacteroidales bacterium]
MLIELKKFYDELEAKQAAVLTKDVDSIVAERVAKLTESIRNEVVSEITAESAILDIKKQTIAEAMEILKQKEEAEKTEPEVEEAETTVTFPTN